MRFWTLRVVAVAFALASVGTLGAADRKADHPVQSGALAGLPPDSTQLKAVQLKTDRYVYDLDVSPDGRLVAFTRNGGDLCVYNVVTKRTRVIARNSNAHDPAWSPDGMRLAFQGDDSVRVTTEFWIWLVNRDGSGLRRVSGSGPDGKHPIWTRDGRKLVWTQGRRLWEADTGGAGGRFLTPRSPDRWHLEFARGWTPDGSRLVYISGSEMGEEFRLRAVGGDSTDDSPCHPLRLPTVSRSELGLSADGRLLYRGGDGVIEVSDPWLSGEVRRYPIHPASPWGPVSLSADRSLAAFWVGDEETGEVWLVRLSAPR